MVDRFWEDMFASSFSTEGSENLPKPNGELRINPDPGRLRQFYPHLNAMTIICSQQIDDRLYETDVVVNVDTLVPYDDNYKLESIYNHSMKFTYGVHDTIKHPENAYPYYAEEAKKLNILDMRYKLNEYVPLRSVKLEPLERKELNLHAVIVPDEWSCCTACCCDEAYCGFEYSLTADECKALDSYRTRLSYLSFMKINRSKEVVYPKKTKITPGLKKALLDFNRYLSVSPYYSKGIPVHSTLFATNANWRGLWKIFLQELSLVDSSVRMRTGPLGMYYEIEDCKDMQQKHSCAELIKCRKEDSILVF
ncbi:hypothetical protein AB6A40_008909 [Gnathostoma spinigerum]|uniref:Uncharacterized protein n=1 Tax=Gnathostoma spinigerum TaxID=75299 RepID=A0ABD6F0J6_9BILA